MKETLDFFKTLVREFLNEPLPDKVGWSHIFGSMLLALFALQFLTGLLLSFVYAASPESAFRSVEYLTFEMQAGGWLRGIHYWGASVIVVVTFAHLVRTFVYSAYKHPRAATWIAGVFLLLFVLAFVQTGYLLPWDQRAYWGTSVTIRIIASAPFIGPKLGTLLKGGATVGPLTLSRFYSVHVVVLPLATTLFVMLHLFLIRRYGITAPWSKKGEDPPRITPFYPAQAAKDATGMLLVISLVLILGWLLPAPLGRPADPTDTTTVPRPDWYFLFLFQMLHYFEGKSEVIGTFFIPTIGIIALFALPFIDRNPSRRLRDRPLALTALIVVIGMWILLTYVSVAETPRSASWKRPNGIELSRAERIKRPSEVGGLYVLKQRCFECHSMTILGGRRNLQTLSRRSFPSGASWLQSHLQKVGRDANLTDREVVELMSILRLVAGDDSRKIYAIPAQARFGAHMFYNKSCIFCHVIDGQGAENPEGVRAPDLTLRLLRAKQWHIDHIRDAQSVVPNSKMPPFLHYDEYELDALAEYILYLHAS